MSKIKGLIMVVALVSASLGAACDRQQQQPTIDDQVELQASLTTFHRNLRWSRFETASAQVDESYRQSFTGRYEELGDDFHIVALEVKKVELDTPRDPDVPPEAIVEVEQRSYREPNMVVKKVRYVERWRQDRMRGWMLMERIERDEWRERKKKEKDQREADAKSASSIAEPARALRDTDA